MTKEGLRGQARSAVEVQDMGRAGDARVVLANRLLALPGQVLMGVCVVPDRAPMDNPLLTRTYTMSTLANRLTSIR